MKITATAKKDFFDRANQIQRRKGEQFVLKSEYASTLNDFVSVDKKEVAAATKAETEAAKPVVKAPSKATGKVTISKAKKR